MKLAKESVQCLRTQDDVLLNQKDYQALEGQEAIQVNSIKPNTHMLSWYLSAGKQAVITAESKIRPRHERRYLQAKS